jgi:fibronectin type 3 domain-containing protein
MRRVVILASTIASGLACVSLDVPDKVAECRAAGACHNSRSDASPDESRMDVPTFASRTDGRRDAEANVADSKAGPGDANATPESSSICTQAGPSGSDCPSAGGSCDVPTSAPTNVVVTSGDQQLGLFWTAVPGASQYRVSRGTSATGIFAQVASTAGTSYLDKPLTNGATYYYVVAASDGSCWSVDSAVASGTPSATLSTSECAQAPPTHVQAFASGSVQATLTWTAPTPAPPGYGISRSRVSGSGYESVAIVAGTVTTYTDTDPSLVKDTQYYYRVSAEGSCPAQSSEVSVTTACLPPAAPAAPTVSNSNGTITAAWLSVSGATAYSICRDTNPSGTFAEVVSSNQTASSYVDAASGLSNGQTYYYKVSASNAAGQCISPLSDGSSAMSCAPPDVPTGLKASPRGPKQVDLTWTASSGARQYAILRGTSSGAEVDLPPPTTPLTTTSYTDTSLTADTTYYYRIRAQNGANSACSSAPSPEVVATPTSCIVLPGSKSNYTANTTNAYCFITCWDLPLGVAGVGLNAVNFAGRTFTINGLPVNCPSDCTLPSNLTKDYSTYPTTGAYVFRVTAGSDTSANNTWWSPKPGRDCQ